MERWLSKSRVLLGLCGVLLLSALNRQDPMVYGMFLFLAVVSVLGFVLPWLSLQSISIQLGASGSSEVEEGASCDLLFTLRRTSPWPAFMVTVDTEWKWASRSVIASQTIPVVRSGSPLALGGALHFACRGHYELVAVRLSSGFPLGLMKGHRSLPFPGVRLHVLPAAQPVRWPLPWHVAEDPVGELTTRRTGQSYELGMLRPYQQGDAVGRISWHASARTGELVMQYFQQSGSIRLRVVVQVPAGNAFGDAQGAGEQAIRLAWGVCDAALAAQAQLTVHLQAESEPICRHEAIRHALAGAPPAPSTLVAMLARAARECAPGEQVAVVVPSTCPPDELTGALVPLVARGCHVVVCIAMARIAVRMQEAQVGAVRRTVERAGCVAFVEPPA